MVCDVLDWRCVLVSELAGTAFIAGLMLMVFYFIIASRMNWGFTTTVGFLFPILLLSTLAVTGFSAVMAFSTMVIGFIVASLFNKVIGNR